MPSIAIDKPHSTAISLVRVCAMLSIVMCHFMQAYDCKLAWIFNIGVQVFFVLSGYLYGHKEVMDWKKWFLLRFIKIYVPLYIYTTIALTFIKFFSDVPVFYLNYLKAGGVPGLDHLWFMKAIAVCYLVTPILQFLKRYSLYVFLFLILIGAIEYCSLRINLFTFSWLWLYSIGYFYPSMSNFCKRVLLVALFILATVLTINISWDDILIYDGIFNRLWHDILGATLCLGGILFFRMFAIQNLTKAIEILDKNSFYIYITHHIYLIGPLTMVPVFSSTYLGVSVIMLAIVMSTVLLAYVSNKSINKLNRLVG